MLNLAKKLQQSRKEAQDDIRTQVMNGLYDVSFMGVSERNMNAIKDAVSCKFNSQKEGILKGWNIEPYDKFTSYEDKFGQTLELVCFLVFSMCADNRVEWDKDQIFTLWAYNEYGTESIKRAFIRVCQEFLPYGGELYKGFRAHIESDHCKGFTFEFNGRRRVVIFRQNMEHFPPMAVITKHNKTLVYELVLKC